MSFKKIIGPRKVCHIDGDMVAVVRSDRFFRFPKTERLITADIDMRHHMARIIFDSSRRSKYVLVESGNSLRSSFARREVDSSKSLRHIAKCRAALKAAKPVAPRTRDGKVILVTGP